jgi:hypothetical protein
MQDKNKNCQPMSEGFRVMAREKALAEQFLVIMNDFGRKDITQYVRGITLYAEAKAEFDGLLTELEHELEQAMAPNQSEKFAAVLEEAVAKRVAFTSFVTDTLIPHTDGAQRRFVVIGDFIKGAAELVRVLADAGLAIWHEFRSGNEARRKEIKQELESLRWPQFTAPSGR